MSAQRAAHPSQPSLADHLRRVLGIDLGRLRIHAPRPLRPPPDDRIAPLACNLRFALVTPVLNGARFIGSTIGSVLGQRHTCLDYLVKDGGSADDTLARAQKACGDAARVLSSPDRGLASALNQAFALVDGDIMGWLNADDLLLPGALHHVANFFASRPEIDVIYGHRILIDAAGNEIGRWWLPPHDDRVLSYADYVPQETLFWRRSIWERSGARIDESFRFAVDWDLLVRFRDAGARFERLPRYLGAFRVHAAQKTATELAGIGLAEKQRIWMRTLGHVPSRWELARGTAGYLAHHALRKSTAARTD